MFSGKIKADGNRVECQKLKKNNYYYHKEDIL
jgi:hypothetical protein